MTDSAFEKQCQIPENIGNVYSLERLEDEHINNELREEKRGGMDVTLTLSIKCFIQKNGGNRSINCGKQVITTKQIN